jgi:peroxiredoxin
MKNLFFITCISLLFLQGTSKSGYQIGDTVSNFTLKNFDGKMVSLSDYKNEKGVILIFDCNTCPYSQAYNERIIELNKVYKPKGFPVVTINSNDPKISPGDSFDEMVRQAKNKKYTFPYLFDASQEIGHAYGATNTPHVYILKSEGKELKVAYKGAIDNNSRNPKSADKKYVELAVNALLSNEEVPIKETKAIGCSIKYR